MLPADATATLRRFDALAKDYERWFGTRLGAFASRRERDLVLGMLRARASETILEVGSGTGYFLREVARGGARCIGIEPSPQMLSVAVTRTAANVRYVRGCAEALPFEQGCMDAVLFMTTLEFVRDVDLALQEARRVLRGDGRLVFGVLNAAGPWARARRRQGGLWAEARFFGAKELISRLSALGSVEMDYCLHVPPWLGWLPSPLMNLADAALRRAFPTTGALIAARVTPRRAQ